MAERAIHVGGINQAITAVDGINHAALALYDADPLKKRLTPELHKLTSGFARRFPEWAVSEKAALRYPSTIQYCG